jgi:tyrosyl-tRNA synthetase
MTNLLDELGWRGLIDDQTPGLAERLTESPIRGYVGFDPTARSLQLGNLVPIMLLVHLQRCGSTPIVVLGGGTGRIGDPSGKRAERPLLDPDTLRENVERQRTQFSRLLDFDTGPNAASLVDNTEWLTSLRLVDFLRDIGKHFTLSYMLQKESVKSRLDSGISYTEFSYMLLQAYDFLHLYRTHQCELQLGGSDQWGNITAGRELVRRVEGAEVHGLCAPLLTTASGAKFGKSESGAIWLDPDMTSPYTFYQFWINADDRDMPALLRTFSLGTKAHVTSLIDSVETEPGGREAQRALAQEMTQRVHGSDTTQRAEAAAQIMFGQLEARDADAETWRMLARELPTATVDLSTPKSAVELATAAGLCASNGEARRLLRQRGIRLNGVVLQEDTVADGSDVLAGGYLWLRRGKKTDALLVTASQ